MKRLLLSMIVLLLPTLVGAVEHIVQPAKGAFQQAITNAQAGDTIRLLQGTYFGSVVIDKPLTIIGEGATVDGQEQGSTLKVDAPDVKIKGLTVIGSGSGGKGLDAGITLTKRADRAIIEGNRVLGNLVGVDMHGPENAIVARNYIEGRQDLRMNDRGNGVYVWNSPGGKVVGNDIRYGRDGIFVNVSKKNTFTGNRMRDLRFAIHYMYANKSTVSGNFSSRNHLGFAIMFSKRVVIENNLSLDDRDHGIMMNYTNESAIRNNRIEGGGDKCVFIYNAHKNSFQGNSFERCKIGIHFTAGSERNEFSGNSFVGNRTQVKYVGSKWVEWSTDGTGNYWSDHAAFDLDGNGVADSAYRPNDMMDHVLWTQPAAKALLGSPAVQLIRWSQSAFPATLPGGVIDRTPMMHPARPEIPIWKELQ